MICTGFVIFLKKVKNSMYNLSKILFFIFLTPGIMNTQTLSHNLVNIKDVIPEITLDIRYATTNNFTGKAIYSHAECFLLEHVTHALKKVQNDIKKKNLGLKIFDGYRPRSVQYIFWELVPDARYVADPKKGSKHNRGCAVDVTLIDLTTGSELPMPTEFDDFTERAHSNYPHVSTEIIANRTLLHNVMHKHGFIAHKNEWWHFDYKDWEKHPLLNISL